MHSTPSLETIFSVQPFPVSLLLLLLLLLLLIIVIVFERRLLCILIQSVLQYMLMQRHLSGSANIASQSYQSRNDTTVSYGQHSHTAQLAWIYADSTLTQQIARIWPGILHHVTRLCFGQYFQ